MTVIEIVKAYLKKNGYDGLVDLDNECGCSFGTEDVAECDNCFGDCEAAHEEPCNCKDGNDEHDFHMVPGKRKVKK